MIRVLVVDDHQLIRSGIKRLLEAAGDIAVVGEAESGEQALARVGELHPDVVLMDIHMPGIGGLEATRKLVHHHPGVRVISLSVQRHDPYPEQLLAAGATGYLTKDCGAEEFVHAIRKVHAGERYLDADLARGMALSRMPGTKSVGLADLSQREMQVMMMVVQGRSIQEISDKLFISPKTVNTYRYRLFEKLCVHNDVELTRLAMRHGLLDLNAG